MATELLELLLEFGGSGSKKELSLERKEVVNRIEREASDHFQVNVALCGISAGGGSAGHILQR